MVVVGLARSKDERAVHLLLDLLADDELAAHATIALGRLRSPAVQASGSLTSGPLRFSGFWGRQARAPTGRPRPGHPRWLRPRRGRRRRCNLAPPTCATGTHSW